ncbi:MULTISPECIES: hypothetical protein [unclassified Rhodococcus (in: high G+C Gram-positive bacteria)]|uniref:hypothetical protein n=1 Tax=Rhodococcus TaxID=1827 RepID=UPI0007DA4351|nr:MULTISPECIES: hypothetical protein [unclassified Rhodococcus (in: high G+C Gram-positive bacteria)]APE12712.1 hypothetical protein BO226_25535 [Rhodococcus sp. 2G]
MLDDEDRGYRDGRRAGARFARNPTREPKDPAIPRWVSDPHVYLRFWQEGWVQGMSDPAGTRLRHPRSRPESAPPHRYRPRPSSPHVKET